MDEKERASAPGGMSGSLHWWHLGALLALITAVESGRMILGGAELTEAVASLPHSLYPWCPVLAGVTIAIRRADRRSSRAGVAVGLSLIALMVSLDLLGAFAPPPLEFTTVVDRQGDLQSRSTTETGGSWVLTAADWIRGDLVGVGDASPARGAAFSGPHPRTRAAEAFYDASLVLAVFGILGLVIAAGRWIRGRVTFRRKEDERGAHLVVAWLLSPLMLAITLSPTDGLFHTALFRGRPLWTILLPSLVLLAVGVYAWIRAARTPLDDGSAETAEP